MGLDTLGAPLRVSYSVPYVSLYPFYAFQIGILCSFVLVHLLLHLCLLGAESEALVTSDTPVTDINCERQKESLGFQTISLTHRHFDGLKLCHGHGATRERPA